MTNRDSARSGTRDVAHWRMRNLGLSGAPFRTPEEVVRWLGAVQSQDYGPAKWSVGQRIGAADGGADAAAAGGAVSDADLDRAFDDGAILRTHVLRPTWHFVLPEDIRWMLALTGPRVHGLNGYAYRQMGLDAAVRARTVALLVDALQGGNQLTRKELAAIFERDGIDTAGFRMGYLLMHAELEAVICSGGLRGKQHTYALLDERVPRARQRSRDEALAELTRRYFTSHGPATAKDFRWWSSLTLADISTGLELVEGQLDHAVVDGLAYWFGEPPKAPAAASPTVHLLQAYDEYIVGYTESKHVLDASGAARSLPGGRAIFNHVAVLDTQVAGHWKRTLKKDAVVIEAALYEPFDDAQAGALQAAADGHGAFLGLPATVTHTPGGQPLARSPATAPEA
jgi:hypothetical protein